MRFFGDSTMLISHYFKSPGLFTLFITATLATGNIARAQQQPTQTIHQQTIHVYAEQHKRQQQQQAQQQQQKEQYRQQQQQLQQHQQFITQQMQQAQQQSKLSTANATSRSNT